MVIYQHLTDFVKFPEDGQSLQRDFFNISQMPGIVGAVDRYALLHRLVIKRICESQGISQGLTPNSYVTQNTGFLTLWQIGRARSTTIEFFVGVKSAKNFRAAIDEEYFLAIRDVRAQVSC